MARRTEMDESVIRDPAQAIAAGKCWLTRKMGGRVGSVVADHPEECAWCQFDPDFIIEKITEFLDWGGLKPSDKMDDGDPLLRPYIPSIESFMQLPDFEQKRLVRQAQGIEHLTTDEPERLSDVYR